MNTPTYGVADHYLGDKGVEYFGWQRQGGDFAGRINTHKFKHLIRPNDTVVDFGCGAGFLLRNLVCEKRIGIEVNPIARDFVRSNGIECYSTAAELPDGCADVIVSDHALEHVPYPIGALQELHGKLKENGLLAICVPHNNYWEDRTYRADDQNHHLHSWTCQTFGNTLWEAGYEIVSIANRTHAWPGRWTVACYGRLPLWLFDTVCTTYGLVAGKGQQVFAVARRRKSV
jgi:SAM-dependent methyltransferase